MCCYVMRSAWHSHSIACYGVTAVELRVAATPSVHGAVDDGFAALWR